MRASSFPHMEQRDRERRVQDLDRIVLGDQEFAQAMEAFYARNRLRLARELGRG